MDLIIAGIVAGAFGTITMDILNHLVARTGMILKIDVEMIGRMSTGWTRGRFRYSHPDDAAVFALRYGLLTCSPYVYRDIFHALTLESLPILGVCYMAFWFYHGRTCTCKHLKAWLGTL